MCGASPSTLGAPRPCAHVFCVNRSCLDAETSNARRVWHTGVQVCPREAQQVARLDDDPKLRGRVHGLFRLGNHGGGRIGGRIAAASFGPNLFQVPLTADVFYGSGQ
jgi:hypothetical protein